MAVPFAGLVPELCVGRSRIAPAVGPYQLGIGRKAGCELVRKLVSALTDEDPSRTVLAFDASNAFGSLPRQRV